MYRINGVSQNGTYLYCLKVPLLSINVLLNYQFSWYFIAMKDGNCSKSSVSMFTNKSNKLNKIRPLQGHEARGAQIPSTRLQRLLNFVWWNLLHVITLLESRILRWIMDNWKIFAPLLEAFQIVLRRSQFICLIIPNTLLIHHVSKQINSSNYDGKESWNKHMSAIVFEYKLEAQEYQYKFS